MANSFVSVRAVEGQTDFPFNFTNGYLHEDHIRTYVDGVEVSRTISGGVAIIAPVSEGQEVIVARQSPQTPVITFEDGSILNKQNVDTQNRHAFMLAEEAAEQRNFFALGDIDMNYHKIVHVAPGTDQYDVVNKGQFDYFLDITNGAAERAEQAADEAAASAQLAGSHASTAQGASAAAEAYADAAQGFAEDAEATVDGFDAHAEAKKDEVTAEGDDQSARVTAIGDAQVSRLLTEGTEQVQRVQAEGDAQYGRAKTEADRAQTYAEILERPYEDMGGHTIQQGYPPVPSFSSMWTIVDGGIDPVDGVTQWNIGDVLVYSVQTATWTRLAGNILSGGGEPLPVEILDDLIMQQGKKIRFRIDEFLDTVGLELDADGDVVVGEIPTTPSTSAPALKIGLAAQELYRVTGTDASGNTVKHKIYDTGHRPTPSAIGAAPAGYGLGEAAYQVADADVTEDKGLFLSAIGDAATNFYNNFSVGVQSFRAGGGDGTGFKLQLVNGGPDPVLAHRSRVLNAWSPWAVVYDTEHKPTAEDVGAVDQTGDVMTGQLGVTIVGGENAIRGTTVGGTFASMRTNPAVLGVVSDTASNVYSPIIKASYVHTAAWAGTYSMGVLNSGVADAGSFTVHHIDDAGGSNFQWNFDGRTGTLRAQEGGFVAHDPNVGWQVQLCATGNAPRWDVLTSDSLVRARMDWQEPEATLYLRNFVGNTNLAINPRGTTSSGPVFTNTAQPADANSLTRKDYVDDHKARSHGDGGGGTYIAVAAPGKLMCTVILLHGGKWYPLTFPMFNATQAWIRNRGGENADRDYDFGVGITYDGYTLGISSIQGSNAPGLPALGQVICW